MTTIYIPKTDSYRGTDATGNDGDSNRTITLTQKTTSVIQGMTLTVDGSSLLHTADFTFSGGTITLLNALWDTSYIDVNYFYTTTTTGVTGQYCTTKQVTEYMGLDASIPDFDGNTGAGNNPEEIIEANGADATTTFYTDKTRIIDNTYTFSYGSSATATQTNLTETTHYTYNKDTGAFKLTATGNTAVGNNGVYAVYKYLQSGAKYSDSVISDMIDRKTVWIDKETRQSWQTTTLNKKEEHTGRGAFDRLYRCNNQPVLFASNQLNGAVTAAATTFVLDDTTGFTAGDYLTIKSEVVLIDTVTDSTDLEVSRAQLGTTAAAHSDNDYLCNAVLETSNSTEGYTPTFTVLSYNDGFEIHSDSGAVQVLHINPADLGVLGTDVYPAHRVFNRLRVTYRSGATSVPDDVNNLCILLVAKEMFNSQVLNALSRGTDGFKTDSMRGVDDEIKRLLNDRRLLLSSRG